MLDCGVPYKLIKDKLKDIKLIFISHTHKDHLNPSTVIKISYEYPNIVFLGNGSVINELLHLRICNDCYSPEDGKWYSLGMCAVKLDYLYHDVQNSALSIDYKNKKLFYCTDTSQINHVSAKDYDLYLIEANYLTDDELGAKIIEYEHNGEFTYLKRVKETHLSQLQALNWLNENANDNSQYVFIHQHIDKEEE